MPSNSFKRLWCKKCNNWGIFRYVFGGNVESMSKMEITEENRGQWLCNECSTQHVSTMLSEIPYEKIVEQQKRFKENRSAKFRRMMGSYQSIVHGYMSGITTNSSIEESDAGLLAIEKVEKEEREQRLTEIKKDIEAHKHLGRNEKCSCNSGKKYKKCCLKRIQSYY